jgi:hypothetical protein
MNKSALAEKQQSTLTEWEIVPESPFQERTGPSDVLRQSGQYLKLFTAGVLSGTQTHKRRFVYQSSRGSGKSHAALVRHLYGISAQQFVKILGGTTSRWHDLGEFQINWEHVQHIPERQGSPEFLVVEILKGQSSFAIKPGDVSLQAQASYQADIIQNR